MWCRRTAAAVLAIFMGIFGLSMWTQSREVLQDHQIADMHRPLPEIQPVPTGRASLAKAPEPEPAPIPLDDGSPAAQTGVGPF